MKQFESDASQMMTGVSTARRPRGVEGGRLRSGVRFSTASLAVIVFLVGACSSASTPAAPPTYTGGSSGAVSSGAPASQPAGTSASPAASSGAGTGAPAPSRPISARW